MVLAGREYQQKPPSFTVSDRTRKAGNSTPFHPGSRHLGGREEWLLFSLVVPVVHSPLERRNSTALLPADFRSEHVRGILIHRRFL